MRIYYAVWIGLLIIAVLITLAAKYCVTFPGDVAVERFVQSLVPRNLGWAVTVSRTAEFPWILLTLASIFVLSWGLAGWRAAILSILSFLGMLALGLWLGPVVARPRPSPELVHVFRPFKGYSFPSLFALRYAATFGFLAILVSWKGSGMLRTSLLILCAALLVVGWVARVALGAHWPSDVVLSYYFGFLWAAFLIRFGSQTHA
jgi:membrane-associated phospholipid phosphatase